VLLQSGSGHAAVAKNVFEQADRSLQLLAVYLVRASRWCLRFPICDPISEKAKLVRVLWQQVFIKAETGAYIVCALLL
jgi:hypothetical protein